MIALVVVLGGFGPSVPSALAAPTTMVDLGHGATYAALSGASVGNTVSAVGAPYTTLHGDLGVAVSTQPTGFPPGVVTGTVHVGDAAAVQAHTDVASAYAEIAGRSGGVALAGALAGTTIGPGLHTIAGAVSNTATVTLDAGGDPNAVFVFQVNGAMAMAAGSHTVLTGGAQASHVFWQVNGAGAIGANADFAGTLIAHDAVAVGNASVFNGRAFALTGALTLDDNDVYSAPPVVTITGGAAATTTNTTPTISGTTDVVAPTVVTVTVNGQALTATPSAGTWSVTSPILANATYPVTASVRDGAGNPGSATQQLTIDTILPLITLNGGPSRITNDPTPTIAGTTDAAPGTIVRVTVDAQTLTALVQAGGTWNVSPTSRGDGTRTITAAVTDPAGNQSTTAQELTVDTSPPAATIIGGPDALTDDPTPEITGTANVPPGTSVTVTLADETLTGLVQTGGAWSVTAAALSDGPHRIVMSVSDAAGNTTSFTQRLTVDTVAPIVTITGGPASMTTDDDPTISGTSDAAPGTTVTITIAGQTMTTLLQANGTWNATPAPIGNGTWSILATTPDPAGNVGRSTQTLIITTTPADGTDATHTTGSSGATTPTDPTGAPGSTSAPTPTSAPRPSAPTTGSLPTRATRRPTVTLAATRYNVARGKRVRVRFTLTDAARVTLTVMHGKRALATLTTGVRRAGHGSLTWNGRINRKIAPAGTYTLVVRVASPAGAASRTRATLRIT